MWALGAILYECLTGRRAFDGEATESVLGRVLLDDPVPPRQRNPQVPRDLEAVCLKCLEKDPARRYAAAGELAEELARFLAGEPVSAVRAGIVGRLADSLDRVRLDERLAGYGTLLMVLAPVMLLPEVWFTVVMWNGWSIHQMKVGNLCRVAAFLLAVGYFRGWRFSPDGPHERALWAVWGGYLLTCFGVGTSPYVVRGLPDVDRFPDYHPALANLTALAFFALAPTVWGYAALVGVGFLALAFVMALDLRWAPLEFGAAWAAVLVVIGLRLRRLGRASPAPPA